MKTDIYARVTNKIIADLERGELTWLQPWNDSGLAGRIVRPVRHHGVPYSGINVLVLWSAACERGFRSAMWMTFKQALELGGAVRKGEKGEKVVYFGTLAKSEEREGETVEFNVPFLKEYAVFNVEQIDGLPEHCYAKPAAQISADQRVRELDHWFSSTGADIRHGGDRAFYAPGPDFVQMPEFTAFRDAESYYATLAHEMTHWTRHKSRLDRDFGRKRFGDEGYAMEELVAEIGAAFLCADLGITPETRADHAAYVGSWLKVLKDDKRAVFTAASAASKACDYLASLQQVQRQAA